MYAPTRGWRIRSTMISVQSMPFQSSVGTNHPPVLSGFEKRFLWLAPDFWIHVIRASVSTQTVTEVQEFRGDRYPRRYNRVTRLELVHDQSPQTGW